MAVTGGQEVARIKVDVAKRKLQGQVSHGFELFGPYLILIELAVPAVILIQASVRDHETRAQVQPRCGQPTRGGACLPPHRRYQCVQSVV
jgi:hypothetical protein